MAQKRRPHHYIYHMAYKCDATELILIYIFEFPAGWKVPEDGIKDYKNKLKYYPRVSKLAQRARFPT
jgi:hypothetical protein